MEAPAQPHELLNLRHKAVDGEVFFTERTNNKTATEKSNVASSPHQPTQQQNMKTEKGNVSAKEIVDGCEKLLCAPPSSSKEPSAPLGMLAFASFVFERVMKSPAQVNFESLFCEMTMTIPAFHDSANATYHSVVGQKLVVVDWKRFYPQLFIPCPTCGGDLKQDRSNFSHNRSLFAIHGLDGPPSWAMVMNYRCQGTCKRRIAANSGELLCCLPEHIANQYPVDPRYARGNQHIAKCATDVFEEIILTYTNGDLCSRLLYNSVNKAYIDKVTSYYSFCRSINKKPETYPKKDGEFIVKWPPQGGAIRKLYQDAAMSTWNPWQMSDKERYTREMQAVKCNSAMAQDHTFDVIKNYVRRLGAFAMWDVASETGEIATAVLVTSTKTEEYAHAAEQLLGRTAFAPAAMYSDTWPAKDDFWVTLLGEDIGRLGLFHFLRRIIKTLRQNHMHFHKALTDLLFAIYKFYPPDYEKLLRALKNGTLNGKLHSEMDIEELQACKTFRQRYNKYLRKQIHETESIRTNLHQWHCKYKGKASEGASPAEGKVDTRTGQTLFTEGTKDAVINCQHNSMFLQDLLPTRDMYREIKPPPGAKHNLSEWMSQRAESKLEKYHGNLANFGNSGMGRELCDILNLCGTARYNLAIRHRIALSETAGGVAERSVPVAWQTVVSNYNHTQLAHINKMAEEAGADDVPFKWVEPLPEDNGERFFSEYLDQRKQIIQQFPNQLEDRCPCAKCTTTQQQKQQNDFNPNLKLPPGVPPQEQNTIPHPNAINPNLKPPPGAVMTMTQPNPMPRPNPKPPPLPPPRYIESPMQQPPPAPVYAPPAYTPFPPYAFHQEAPPQQPTRSKEFCCRSFAHWWVYKRYGRPPHDDDCFNRAKNKIW
jgi:hypothetical protein